MADAANVRLDVEVLLVESVQRAEDVHRSLQGIGAAVGDGGVRHVAVHRHLQLQAAVVRHHHLVAEARSDHQVGPSEALLQQPLRPELAAVLLVVSEVQLNRARQRRALARRHGLDGAQRESVGAHVALAHGAGAAVDAAVDDLATVGVVRPAFAWRHDVAVRVERDGWPRTEAPANDEVGDALQARSTHCFDRHSVALGG